MVKHGSSRAALVRAGRFAGLGLCAVGLPAFAVVMCWLASRPAGLAAAAVLASGWGLIAVRRYAFGRQEPTAPGMHGASAALAMRPAAVAALDRAFAGAKAAGRQTGCIVVSLDEGTELANRIGSSGYDAVLRQSADRLSGLLRECDVLARLDGARFAVALHPARRLDLETLVQISTRLQDALAPPFSLDASTVHVTASVGFCAGARAPEGTGEALLAAAECAADEAARCGPTAIRSYSAGMTQAQAPAGRLRGDIEPALDSGQIVTYFQPQLSTDTGAVSGFEALARWTHPERGLLVPADFLPDVIASGLSARLGEIILYHALTAIKSWDRAGFHIPSVSVSLSKDDLNNPKLAEKLKWELDRFELPASRLSVQITETVMPDTDADSPVRTVAALAAMGCITALDDFGTGDAPMASMRRFSVSRISVDRSFIAGVDMDEGQRRTISAVLSMADRLGIATLAKGVETLAEHSVLGQLGCAHVQGSAVARPMPFEDTCGWLERHRAKLVSVPKPGRRAC